MVVQGWRLVLTGHSLGAGVAALIALKLLPDLPGQLFPAARSLVSCRCACQSPLTTSHTLAASKLPPGT